MILVMVNELQEKSNLDLEWHGGLVSRRDHSQRRTIGCTKNSQSAYQPDPILK
jgi:hypothetical protein